MREFGFRVIVVLVLVVLFFPSGAESAGTQQTRSLQAGGSDAIILINEEGTVYKIELTVTSGSKVDVYIMTVTERLIHYSQGRSFRANVSKERRSSVSFKWEKPDDDYYALVVCNMDNGRSSDAIPTGSVRYTLKYEIVEGAEYEMFLCEACFLGFLMVVVFSSGGKNERPSGFRARQKAHREKYFQKDMNYFPASSMMMQSGRSPSLHSINDQAMIEKPNFCPLCAFPLLGVFDSCVNCGRNW